MDYLALKVRLTCPLPACRVLTFCEAVDVQHGTTAGSLVAGGGGGGGGVGGAHA
jgi:hypothetical protein